MGDCPIILRIAAILLPATPNNPTVYLVRTISRIWVSEEETGDRASVRSGDSARRIGDRCGKRCRRTVRRKILREAHLSVEIGLTEPIVFHGPVVEPVDHAVFALNHAKGVIEMEDV